MAKTSMINQLKQGLIVSCQAEEGFPLNTPEHLTALAQSAVIGGAKGIRASDPDNIRLMKQKLDVPIIGIYKYDYDGFEVRITPTLKEIEVIIEAGSDIVALDATKRPRPDGMSLDDLFANLKARYDVPLMADISTLDEGIKAAEMGADIVATTLSGYTDYSPQQAGPDLALIRDLAAAIDVPIIAEGRIGGADDVQAALQAGAHAVVVGSMITRPHMITERFVAGTSPVVAESVIAIDIGGTKIAGGIVTAGADLQHVEQVSTPATSGARVIIQTIELIKHLAQALPEGPPAAIGISTGGQISPEGHILSATDTITDWAGIDLVRQLQARFQRPVRVLNDGHAATLAEAHYGASTGYQTVLGLTIGTGLGGGLVYNGRLHPGNLGLAGSIGHIKIVPDGRRCSCGRQGCVEAYVSGPALRQAYNAHFEEQAASSGQAVADLALAGDQLAQSTVKEMGRYLGLGIANGLATLDADVVVIGGSVAQIGDLLFESIRQGLAEFGFASTVNTPIVPSTFGPQAGLIGAAIAARQRAA
ncbi:MAG: putative N-acetylmannosamine-6-phosphate 2-epimerase [Chloroflexota bacterium]